MQLLDMVFCDDEAFPRGKDCVHHIGVASHLLLVTVGERSDVDRTQQLLHFNVRKRAAFEPRG